MKKTWRSKVSLALTAAILASVIAGCGGGNTPAAGSSGAPASSTPASPSASTPAPSAEPVKFSLAFQRLDAMPPITDVTLVQEIISKSNADITWIDWPSSAIAEKKSLAFASGDYPDAIMGAWVVSQDEVIDYAAQGLIIPLDPYLNDDVMPNYNSYFKARPDWTTEMVTPDGHIYTLASLSEVDARPINDSMVINLEWLEKVGMEIPKTTDDLHELLKAFKAAGDLNGNGKNDEIPMLLKYGDHMRGIFSIMGFFGNAGSQNGFTTRDGNVLFNAIQPEYKETMKYLNTLYSEGLIDPEMFTVTASAYVAKITAAEPVAGVFMNWSHADPNITLGRDAYGLVPPLKAYPDVEPVWQARSMPLAANLCFVVTDKAQDPAGILAFADLFYEKDTSIQNFFGLYDKHVRKLDGIKHEWILNKDGNPPTYEERYPDVLTNRGMWLVLEDDFEWTERPTDKYEKVALETYVPFIEKTPYPRVWLTTEESTDVTLIANDVNEYVKNTAAKWIANGNIDAEWDSYVAQLQNLQLDRYLEIYQAAFDRTK